MPDVLEYLKKERLKKALSLSDMAERANLSLGMVQAFEKGDLREIGTPALVEDLVRAYCRVLGINPDALGARDKPGVLFPATGEAPGIEKACTSPAIPAVTRGRMRKLAGIAVLVLLIMAAFTGLLRFGYIPQQGSHSSKLIHPLPDVSPEEAPPSQTQLQFGRGQEQTGYGEGSRNEYAGSSTGEQQSKARDDGQVDSRGVENSKTIPSQTPSHQKLEMEIEGDTRTDSLSEPQPNDRLEPATSAMESAETPRIDADEHRYGSSDTPTRESADTRTTAEDFTSEMAPDKARSLEPGPERDNHRFEIKAVEKCWIKVRVDNTLVDEILLRPGAKKEWEAAKSIQVSLGNAGGVCMKWDGKPLAPVGKSGRVIHFVLPNPDLTQKAQPLDGSRCDVFETMPGAAE